MDVRLMDYRELAASGLTFDRVVSVGMLEHVGRGNYDSFLEQVHQVLKPGGLFLLHYISALEEHSGDPWIRKYIFPGRGDSKPSGDHRPSAGLSVLYPGCGKPAPPLYKDASVLAGKLPLPPYDNCRQVRRGVYKNVGALSGSLCSDLSQRHH